MVAKIEILYIGGGASNCGLVRGILDAEPSRFEVTEAVNSDEFRSRLAEGGFDVVVSDLNIGWLEGLEIIDVVTRVEVPLIVLAETEFEESALNAMEAGAADYVIKAPGHIRRLPHVIKNVLNKKALEVENRLNREELQRERDNFRSILNAMEDGVCIDNMEHEVIYVNAALERELGPVEGRACYNYFNGREDPCPWCRNEKLTVGERTRTDWTNPKTGGVFDVSETHITLSDGQIGKLTLMRDISKPQQKEKELAESIASQVALLRAVPLGIGVVVRGVLVNVNNRLCQLLGFTQDDLIGQPESIIYRSVDECERVRQETFDMMTFEGVGATEAYLRRRDEAILRVVIRASATDLDDFEAGITFSVLDVTERKKEERELARYRDGLEELVAERTSDLEKRMLEVEKLNRAMLNLADDTQEINDDLEKLTRQLEDANHELEAFAYSVSHDLRAPLRHIAGFVDILGVKLADVIGEEGQRYVKLVSDAAEKMGRLIDDLLTFSRAGRVDLFKAEIDLSTMVQEVAKDVTADVTTSEIEWVIGDLPHVHADRTTLRQVLVNLIGNAVKYSHKEHQPLIEIGQLPEENSESVIFIKDNGVGFDPEYAHKLFAVFQRLHRVDEFEGTGIGLANVRRIISRHEGRTWAEGKVGEGATFFFSLPHNKTPDEDLQ